MAIGNRGAAAHGFCDLAHPADLDTVQSANIDLASVTTNLVLSSSYERPTPAGRVLHHADVAADRGLSACMLSFHQTAAEAW